MNKYTLVTGAQGLVGSRFVELYKEQETLLTPDIGEFDFLSAKGMETYLKGRDVETVINFAAYTDVASAEKERGEKKGMSWRVNVEGLENLVKVIGKSAYFIHISTDMVFSGAQGDPGPYAEDHSLQDNPEKITWYGYTKSEGERLLKEYLNNLAILRIIYPVRAKYDLKLDYLRKPLKLYNEDKLYPLFRDQQVSISFIDETCVHLNKLLETKMKGIYHSSSSDVTSPFEIISYLIEAKYGVKNAVKDASIYEYFKNTDIPVRYPILGGLKTEFSQRAIGLKYSSWKEIVNKLIEQNIGY
jgi:dTDP-4-dehydrorhamnose reductase